MKIGIFSGTFDPVHSGHIAFALEAAELAGLDKVLLLPEQNPRRKSGVTHYAHRIAMLRLAVMPYQKLEVLDLPDKQFSVNRTLPRIRSLHSDSDLFMLVGSDLIDMLSSDDAENQWPDYRKFLNQVRLIVGLREEKDLAEYQEKLNKLQNNGKVIISKRPYASSRDIRSALQRGKQHKEMLLSLHEYIKDNWLYASLDANNS